ncbi:MAG TPA: TIM barrel protein [Roseiflexaceae bacterium]|nr:TIM barrel protein [Roseiflexaceae bacterium]
MNTITIGCGQITWPRTVPEEQVLAEIARAGYAGAPAAPRPAATAQDTLALYGRLGLRPAPGYLGADFWRPERRDQILDQARQYARFMHEVGCTELYVAAGGFDYVAPSGRTRREASGHVRPTDALSPAELRQFADTLNRVGEITLAEGVRSCFHNHVGTVIETRAETEALLALTDPALVFLGPDTGHLAWAGDDPVAFCRDHARRILTMHLKDIDPAVAERGRAEEWDYGAAQRHGIWTELGRGAIDFPTILATLRGAGFSGWLIVETDVTQLSTPLESATVSREYLRGLGL